MGGSLVASRSTPTFWCVLKIVSSVAVGILERVAMSLLWWLESQRNMRTTSFLAIAFLSFLSFLS